MKRLWLAVLIANCLIVRNALAAPMPPPPSRWQQPATALADQIAGILGPGQAKLTIRNLSTIPADDIPAIRLLLEQDLKARGVLVSGAESANAIRVTLSENIRERLWVAEVNEGSETRVAMVGIQHSQDRIPANSSSMVLHKELFLGPNELDQLPCLSTTDGKPPLIAIVERIHGLLILKQNCLLALDRAASGFSDGKSFDDLALTQTQARDPRGLIVSDAEGDGFLAFLPGTECAGKYSTSPDPNRPPGEGWSLHCHRSDDPWPIVTSETPTGPIHLKAFFNSSRNYFTGVVTPSLGVDLPPFYSAVFLPRAAGPALLIGGIDGSVQLTESGTLKPVSGTRDWGSDFAALQTGCETGTQIIASGSGEALNDSLRAYDLPAREAIPASAPLAMNGTVTALWTAPDGKSVFAVVRRPGNQHASNEYEVDRVTSSCN
jgi:hypothetical protein